MKRVAGMQETILLWQKLHPEMAKSPLFPYILFTSRAQRGGKTVPCGAAIGLVSI
jgi:hypothetical protein